ncbi:MAG: hypothetical protein K6U04_11485 [Armatimonadetes bacterium]|nr:hypothetical protein [Armatimonadota bacterium]
MSEVVNKKKRGWIGYLVVLAIFLVIGIMVQSCSGDSSKDTKKQVLNSQTGRLQK